MPIRASATSMKPFLVPMTRTMRTSSSCVPLVASGKAERRCGKDRAESSYKVFVRDRNYVADFLKAHYKRKDISMLELTPDFIKEFFASKATRGRAQYLSDD